MPIPNQVRKCIASGSQSEKDEEGKEEGNGEKPKDSWAIKLYRAFTVLSTSYCGLIYTWHLVTFLAFGVPKKGVYEPEPGESGDDAECGIGAGGRAAAAGGS